MHATAGTHSECTTSRLDVKLLIDYFVQSEFSSDFPGVLNQNNIMSNLSRKSGADIHIELCIQLQGLDSTSCFNVIPLCSLGPVGKKRKYCE